MSKDPEVLYKLYSPYMHESLHPLLKYGQPRDELWQLFNSTQQHDTMGLGEQRQHALPAPVQVIQRGTGEHLGREKEGFLPHGPAQVIVTCR